MTKKAPKEGAHNTLPIPVVPPKQHLTAAEIRRRAQVKEQAMQKRIRGMTFTELTPDLGFYLDTVSDGGTIKARRLG